MIRPFILFGFLAGATGALADPVLLSDDELKTTVSGATVEIDTPLGSTVPMRFGADGLVSAEAGVLAPVLGAAKDRGRWWVDGDKLCTKWFRWFDAGTRCLTIRIDGSRVYWRKVDDGETGTGTLVVEAAASKPAVVAKAAPPTPPQSKPAPEQEKRATRLAGPAREVPADQVAPSPAPTVVARAEATQPDTKRADETTGSLEDGPTMRFGGVGLLEASSRIGSDGHAGEQAQAPSVIEPRRAKEKPLAAETTAAAPTTADKSKTVAAPRHASLGGIVPAQRAAQKTSAASRDKRSAVATSSTRAVALYRVTGVDRSDVLNVRRGPSEMHDQIAAIPPTGRRVEIIGQCRGDWCPVRYRRVTGWVNSYYLAEEGSRQDPSSQASIVRR